MGRTIAGALLLGGEAPSGVRWRSERSRAGSVEQALSAAITSQIKNRGERTLPPHR